MNDAGRLEYLRPFRLTLILTAVGVAMYFLVWGLWLFPADHILVKLAWTAIRTVAMASVIGVAVMIFVLDRLEGRSALISSALIYIFVLSVCTLICFRIDSGFDYFGGASAPALFILAGLVPTVLSGIPYAWLLHGPKGQKALGWSGI